MRLGASLVVEDVDEFCREDETLFPATGVKEAERCTHTVEESDTSELSATMAR